MCRGVWLTFTGVSNKTSKVVNGDIVTYKVEATPQWIDANKQTVTQTKKTATFVYEGGFN